MNNATGLPRNVGVQPTVYDSEVAMAAARQELAPAGAAPPLVVGMLNKSPAIGNSILVGAPAQNGVHERAATVMANKPHPVPASVEYGLQESNRRVKLANVVGTMLGENVITAIQPRNSFQADLPFIPNSMPTQSFGGVQFKMEPVPRYQFALGNAGQINTAAANVEAATVNAAKNQGIPPMVAQNMGAAAKNAVLTGNGAQAGNEVLRVAAANGMQGNAVNEVANSSLNAVALNKNGNVSMQNVAANGKVNRNA